MSPVIFETQHSDEFIHAFFEKDWNKEFDRYHLNERIEFKIKFTKRYFMELIIIFQNTFKPLEIKFKGIKKTQFDLDTGIAEVNGFISFKSNYENYSGEFFIQFKYDWGFWYISEVMFPNFG